MYNYEDPNPCTAPALSLPYSPAHRAPALLPARTVPGKPLHLLGAHIKAPNVKLQFGLRSLSGARKNPATVCFARLTM